MLKEISKEGGGVRSSPGLQFPCHKTRGGRTCLQPRTLASRFQAYFMELMDGTKRVLELASESKEWDPQLELFNWEEA